jgi:hypothetical protein
MSTPNPKETRNQTASRASQGRGQSGKPQALDRSAGPGELEAVQGSAKLKEIHMAGTSLVERMKGAALLDIETYEDVEHDTTATMQAAAVVVIHALAQAVGNWQLGITAALSGAVGALLAWGVWSGVTYLIGAKVFGGTATWGELLRTIGFAFSPGVLLVLGALPLLGWMIKPAVAIWLLIAGIIAIRQALDFGTGKAIITAVLGWIPFAFVMAMLGMG